MDDPVAGPPTVVLTEPQRRHFEVVLAKLEDALDEIERLSIAEPASQSLTLDTNDLPTDFVTRTAAPSQDTRTRIAQLAVQLGLTPQRASRFRTVRALLIAETVRLQDSFSSALKGYGALDPAAPDVIDPALRELIALLAAMLRALDPPRQTETAGGAS